MWWFTTLKHTYILLLFLSAFIGCACSIIGDLECWNDNDILKHIAPASLCLIVTNAKARSVEIINSFL